MASFNVEEISKDKFKLAQEISEMEDNPPRKINSEKQPFISNKLRGASQPRILTSPEQVISKLSKIAKMVLESEENDVLRFNISSYKNKHISEVFKACDELLEQKCIENYEVNEMNLEDVFLVCCANEKQGVQSITQSLEEVYENDKEDVTPHNQKQNESEVCQ